MVKLNSTNSPDYRIIPMEYYILAVVTFVDFENYRMYYKGKGINETDINNNNIKYLLTFEKILL